MTKKLEEGHEFPKAMYLIRRLMIQKKLMYGYVASPHRFKEKPKEFKNSIRTTL